MTLIDNTKRNMLCRKLDYEFRCTSLMFLLSLHLHEEDNNELIFSHTLGLKNLFEILNSP